MEDLTQEVCELLSWDTEFFGFRIARIQGDTLNTEKAAEVDLWCRQHEIKCLYFLARLDDSLTTQLAEKDGYHFVDVRMTFEWMKSGRAENRKTILLRNAQENDAPRLKNIARNSHLDTRFFFDNHFPVHLSKLLYETWIIRSMEGYADLVLVAVTDNNIPVGYITCHLKGNPPIGQIGLIGVHADHIGHGFGESLVTGALNWFDSRGAQKVVVVTQGRDYVAQRLYQRIGFLTESVKLWYHKWYL